MKMLLTALLALPLMASGRVEAVSQHTAMDPIRTSISLHAPYKQWDVTSGAPNRTIGRTPGATCEAIAFLVGDWRASRREASLADARRLGDWVRTLQDRSADLAVPGGVPSTPDLPGAASSYHYAIDAAFCGTAMLDLADATGDAEARGSAVRFGGFLLAMMRDGTGVRVPAGTVGRAPCEAVVLGAAKPAWNCRRYVKSLIALPLMSRLERIDPKAGYAAAARDMRATLVPGLAGLWEYADGTLAQPKWHRIEGPHGERDMFVYGDTLAYGLKGLHAYEGASSDVRRMYVDFTSPRERGERTRNYDPNVALAGYVVARTRAADPYSAYYDIVTLGLLDGVRGEVDAPGTMRARQVLARELAGVDRLGWHMDMAFRPRRTGMADVSTLASIGDALIGARAAR